MTANLALTALGCIIGFLIVTGIILSILALASRQSRRIFISFIDRK